MTTDELIDLGHKAGTLFITQFGVASVTVEWLENFAALVAAAEREACAVSAWSTGMDLHLKQHDAREIGAACAAAIRARGNT